MDRSALKIVAEALPLAAPLPPPAAARPLAACAWAAALLVGAAVSAWVGVDAVRRPIEARVLAGSALRLALASGSEDPEVRRTLVELRRNLARRPMDAPTRVVYADLLLSLSRTLEETEAAKAHATLAAHQNPVTVPVVRRATLVLVRSGSTGQALELVHSMFGYDPDSAAELLLMLEPGVYREELERGIPDDPRSWFAWARRLRLEERWNDVYDAATRAHERWPDDLPLQAWVAARALADRDFDRLAALLPADRALPDDEQGAQLRIYRARLRASRGDRAGAADDIDQALRVAGDSNLIQILAGEAWEALERYDLAKRHWNRALFVMGTGDKRARRAVLARLARLEDRHGLPSDALRLWQAVLKVDPDHTEARARVDALTAYER